MINHCLENGIGTVVFGWNKGQKDGVNLGDKTNQKFVQVPTARLKEQIKQLCEQYGIRFEETEESYTSKASFLDADEIPVYGEKPANWEPSGKGVKRGLYRSAEGSLINADCNGAANILRKVAVKLGLNLSRISSGELTAPLKLRFWAVQESPYFQTGECQSPDADWGSGGQSWQTKRNVSACLSTGFNLGEQGSLLQ